LIPEQEGDVAVREKGGMWCERCQRPVTARKTGRRVRNTTSVVGALPTAGVSLLFAKTEKWHCSVCGGPVTTARRIAAAPVQLPAPVDGPTVSLTLRDPGPRAIQTIKAIRAVTRVGLREAKGWTDATPSTIDGLSPAQADELMRRLVACGASAEIDVATGPGDDAAEPPDLAAQLERIAALHAAGHLDDAEFAAAKAQLLSS
jgi:large subunit ribosomal protein L7/L12